MVFLTAKRGSTENKGERGKKVVREVGEVFSSSDGINSLIFHIKRDMNMDNNGGKMSFHFFLKYLEDVRIASHADY